MKPAIASLFALGTTFCLMGTKTRHEAPTFGTSRGDRRTGPRFRVVSKEVARC